MNPCVSPDARGDRDRHERAVGCGGRGGALDETRLSRTVKSCGPDAPMLASSWREVILANDGGNKAGHRGKREVSRKPIAQGKPECFRWTCMLVCAIFLHKLAHEIAGAARTRLSLRPRLWRGGRKMTQDSGGSRRENAESYLQAVFSLLFEM